MICVDQKRGAILIGLKCMFFVFKPMIVAPHIRRTLIVTHFINSTLALYHADTDDTIFLSSILRLILWKLLFRYRFFKLLSLDMSLS